MQLVGILNLTPDSFSDGGLFMETDSALRRVAELFEQGASVVDVGAESTRPGAEMLSDEAEWNRLQVVLPQLIKLYPDQISVDSYHPATLLKAFDIGPILLNDVTGMTNPDMISLALQLNTRTIISHLPGRDIQTVHSGQLITTVEQVRLELLAKANYLREHGFQQKNIILDPGIGFGKSTELNWKLLKFAEEVPDYDVMVGYSRKRFLGDERMELRPNLLAGKIARDAGTAYLRVHDVDGHRQLLD